MKKTYFVETFFKKYEIEFERNKRILNFLKYIQLFLAALNH